MPIGQYNNWMPNNWSNGWQWNQPQVNNIQPQINNVQQPVNNILRVTGPESAKAYSIPAKSSVVLFDAENPIFYLKTTDDGGFPHPLRVFTFEELKTSETLQPVNQEQFDVSNFATKEDLAMLETNVNEIKEILEGLVN